MFLNVFLGLLLALLPIQLGRHFWLKASFIFGLKIDYLSPTLYLQDILIFFLIFLTSKELLLFLKSHLKLFTAYFLLLVANLAFSTTPLLSLFSWFRITELIILGLIIKANYKRVFRLLGRFLPWIIIFESILGLLQVFKQSSSGGLFWVFGERAFNILTPGIAKGDWLGKVFLRPYGTFSHPNSLAGFILVALVLIIGKEKLTIIDKLALILGLILLLFSYSKVVWLALLGIGIYLVLSRIFLSLKSRLIVPNYLYVFSVIMVVVVTFFFLKVNIEASSFENRQKLADFSLSLIKQKPLTGVGTNNFIVNLAQQIQPWQWYYFLQPVHNIFLLIFSEIGVIGLGAFVVLILLTLKRLLVESDKLYGFSLLFSLLVIVFTGFFDHYWLTLIQNQLLLVVIFGLSWGKENAKITR